MTVSAAPLRASCWRAIVHALPLLALLCLTVRPSHLEAQTKPMTITGVAPLSWDFYEDATGIWHVSVRFIVKNTGTRSAWIAVTEDCGNWCDGDAWSGRWTILDPGQSATVPVWLLFGYPPPTTSSLVSMTVMGYVDGVGMLPGGSDKATVAVNPGANTVTLLAPIRPSDVSISPNGTTVWVPAGSQTVNFTLTNGSTNTYQFAGVQLNVRCDGFYGYYDSYADTTASCGQYGPYGPILNEDVPTNVGVLAGQPKSVPITVYGNNGQRGTIWLITRTYDAITGKWVADSASMLVLAGDQVMTQVTPKGPGLRVTPRMARVDSFTVRNTGTVTTTYALAPQCGSFAASGCTANPSAVTLAAGVSARVGVAYTPSATNGASSVIQLVATGSVSGLPSQADTGSLSVTAVDAAAPVITITPAQGATITTSTFTATVNVCDDGLISNPVVTFNGAPLPDMFLRALQAGCMTAGTSTFTLAARPGQNTLSVSDGDGYQTAILTRTLSYDDATEVAPQVAAVMSVVKVPPGAAWTDTFTVRNPGPIAAQYTLAATCGTFGGCAVQSSSLTLAAGATAKIAVAYTTPGAAGQAAAIQLTASHTSATNRTVSASASLTATTVAGAPPQLTMTPADGTSYAAPGFTATVTWCDPDDAITARQVWLGGTLLPDTFVPRTQTGCASAGTSTWTNLTLMPWDQLLLAQATDATGHVTRLGHVVTYVPSLTAYQPRVTPNNIATTVPRGVVATQTFAVTNAGTFAAAYQLSASCGAFTVCQADKTAVSLSPGASDSVRISFLVPQAIGAFSPIRLVARFTRPTAGSVADSGTVTAQTPTAYDLFQPKVTTSLPFMLVLPGWIPGLPFMVKNTGAERATYTLNAFVNNGMYFEAVRPVPASITLGPGESQWTLLQPRAGSIANVTSVARLTATYRASDGTAVMSSDSTLVTTQDGIAQLRIVAASPRTMKVYRGYGGQVDATFAVQNVGSYPLDVSLIPTCSALLVRCSQATGVYLDVGQTQMVNVWFMLGLSPDAGTFRLVGSASGPRNSTTGEDSIRVSFDDFKAVSISPDSTWRNVPVGDRGQVFFQIHNDGGAATSYRYRSSCQNVQGQFFLELQSCADSGFTASIAPGDSASVPVKYTASAVLGQSGFLRVDAWDVSDALLTSHGRVFLATDQIVPLTVRVADAGATANVARNQCLTIRAGDAAAYECGDLRLVHELPTTTTISRARTPTLLYNSRHHSGVVLFPVDVSVSSGNQFTQLRARLTIDGQLPETTTFAWNPQWNSRSTMRIVVPLRARMKGLQTGAYHYWLAVDGIGGGVTLSSQDSGTVAIVNRATSEFGPGWWLDGYERLVPYTAAQTLWVGGDGSTRLYTRVGTSNVWAVRPTLDRPDSLVFDGIWWSRRLRNGAYVQFSNAGLHVATVDSRGRVTRFNHDDSAHPSWLTSITLPVPIGSAAVRQYVFGHDGGNPFVTWVDAPGAPVRRVRLQYATAADGSTVLGRIVDPDNLNGVGFNFGGDGKLSSRVDRRGHTTSFSFDAAGGLLGSTLNMAGTGPDVVLGFCSAETATLSACAPGPIDTGSVVTRFDGPRTDVLDSTWFRVTRYGAPWQITDALKHVTRIERESSRWPLLVTRTIDPVGFTTSATYDSLRALLLSTTEVSPRSLVGGPAADSSATTTYRWHDTWDVVTQATSPAGVLTVYDYDAANGDLLSQRVGTGAKRRVTYGYDTPTRLVNSVTTLQSPNPTRYSYDALGNLGQTTTPLGLSSTIARDYLGRDSVVRTPVEQTPTATWREQRFTYDVFDQVRTLTDSARSNAPNSAMKLTVLSDYDAEGNLISVTRRATPDSLGLGDLVLTADFDAANRKTREVDPYRGTLRSWAYDAAGNAIRTVRGTDTDTAEFDALNRVTRRAVPGVPNAITPEAATDDQRFSYGPRGELIRATNRYADVRRVYNLSGGVVYDTSIVYGAALSTPSVNQHVYGNAYTYDLDGRRKSLRPPTQLSVLAPVTYGYDQETGELATVSVENGGVFRYAYNQAGLLDSLIQADGTVERHYYDDDGRETRRTEYDVVKQMLLHDESVALDARGKRLVIGASGYAGAQTEQYTYDGFGAVLNVSGRTFESTPRDPLGNARLRVNSSEDWAEQYLYEQHSTRLRYLSRQLNASNRIDSLSQTFNLAGDLARVIDRIVGPQLCLDGQGGFTDCPPPSSRVIAQSTLQNSYDGDGHLLLSVKETTNDESATWPAIGVRDPNWYEVYAPFERGVTEEYRYDALGRRVWVRAHRDAYCPTQRDRDSTTVCLSTVERTIYDGDQVIAEIRQPGGDSVATAALESDDIAQGSPAQHFGQVGYVHGTGIDRPLELWRNYGGSVTKLVTHYQWQGALELGTTLGGQLIQCGLPGVSGACEEIDWPGAKIRFGLVLPHPFLGPASWWGTMAGMKENATGMQDMRNRQYDPKTGRFTQEDPIGLAGGMNLYGFGGGDPVNYSDPFGLCVWDLCIGEGYATAVAAAGLATLVTAAYIDLTNKFGPPTAWFSKSSTSGETPATTGGRAAHKAWDPGAGFQKEFRLQNGKRCDALNPETCEIKELKPDNERAKKRGEKQLKQYKEERERETGKEHRTTLETYKPKQP